MTFFCISLIVSAFFMGLSTNGLRETAGYVIIPFEKSINAIGGWLLEIQQDFQSKEELQAENEALQEKVDTLTAENNSLIQQQGELERLKELYELDQEYAQYPKVMANVISKDPGNWYDTFVIDKGTADGVQVDSNVLAGQGLAGIVIEANEHWSTVRSIIDDSSNVSAMTTSTSDTCVVQGNLQLIDEGKLHFEQLYDEEDIIQVGERLVTSHISDKYLEGIFIGYISEISYDDNNLTKTGTLVTPVDFGHLREVLVITALKQDVSDPGADSGEQNADSAADAAESTDSSAESTDAQNGDSTGAAGSEDTNEE